MEVLEDGAPPEIQEAQAHLEVDRVVQALAIPELQGKYHGQPLCIITDRDAALPLRSALHMAVADTTAVDRHPHIELEADHLWAWHRMHWLVQASPSSLDYGSTAPMPTTSSIHITSTTPAIQPTARTTRVFP